MPLLTPKADIPMLWAASVYLPEGSMSEMREATLRVQEESQSQARRWQSTDDPAYDGHELLAPGRYTHVGATVYGNAIRSIA